ncbi:TetR/AcrR family transcriptional regulator [Terribacillus saccharophilus]|uniref:TetR/AcrR family transcriptional regulator n=1 Tax=Terribacillus saccharophilus TaxID=361277 RepID=UPI0038199B28
MKKSEERRNQILSAAFEAVKEHGFHAVTLQVISDYGGFSKGVVSYYFKNKESIFSELFRWLTDKIYHKEKYAVHEQETAEAKLKAYIYSVFISPEKNFSFYKVYLEFLAQSPLNDEYKKTNIQFYNNCFEIAEHIIKTGIEQGVYSNSINIKELSKTMRAIIDGCLIQWLMTADKDSHDRFRDNCLFSISKLLS